MKDKDTYVLGYRHAEQQRLQAQAQDLAAESAWLFDRIGIAPGDHVVEIGCGPQGCLGLLAERVGSGGKVVGIERNEEAVRMARAWVRDQGLGNVEVVCIDARASALPASAFDVVTSRLVLVNVGEPAQIVAVAVALARPGGVVAFHEADYVSHVCDPPCDAWTRLVDLLAAYSKANGIDPFIGRTLPRLLRDAGLCDVQVRPLIHVYPPGHGRRSILLDFAENLSGRLVGAALVDEAELSRLKASLRAHLDDPGTLVVSHLFFQAWGRKAPQP